ncbi:hypothetical protein INT43_008842 [Umbelopsis isabellina]|uniref:TIGR02453 family protein n=1 Tax=Mortierella isabellina TaxID=91625 RepID=A0A8H7PVB9_MORIS|nr:hypothetical protein INT43_008842 [Umbelopsis isabellina]
MVRETRSIKQANVKPNSNSVQPTRLRTRVSRANDLVASQEKEDSIEKPEPDSDDSSEEFMEDKPRVTKKSSTKRRNSDKGANESGHKAKKGKKKEVESLETVRVATDVNPAILTIPRPKGAPFPDAMSPDSLQFMADLAENNDREFMLLHNDRWLKTRQDFVDFVDQVMRQARELDPTILEIAPKDAVYRLNRDLRFTNDRRPYKTFLSASFSRGGKKSPFAGYYLSVCPGGRSFVGAGVWSPSSAILARIRQGILEDSTLLRQSLEVPLLEEIWGQKGTALLDDDQLKTAPKGVDKQHPDIDLLRYKSFVVGRRWDDLQVLSPGFLEKVAEAYEALVPFVTVLNAWTG